MPNLVPLLSFLISTSYFLIIFLGINGSDAFCLPLKGLVVPKIFMGHDGSWDYLLEDGKKTGRFRNDDEFTGLTNRRSAFSCALVALLGYSQGAIKPSFAASNNDCLEECLRECFAIVPNPNVSAFKPFTGSNYSYFIDVF
jgi:hypothetical protein